MRATPTSTHDENIGGLLGCISIGKEGYRDGRVRENGGTTQTIHVSLRRQARKGALFSAIIIVLTTRSQPRLWIPLSNLTQAPKEKLFEVHVLSRPIRHRFV